MNLINYKQAIEALDKERQLLLNCEQYGAEHVLVHHAINVIAELPIIRQPEIVRCKYCRFSYYASNRVPTEQAYSCSKHGLDVTQDWFCADGERKSADEILMEEWDADPLG